MVTGGAPSNVLALKKYENNQKEKLANPFKQRELSYEQRILLETAHIGPGMYSPQQAGEIGGSDTDRSKR